MIDQHTFEKEINICKKQSTKNDGHCNWGKCNDCGVIPLLYKLNKNEVIEETDKILELKKKFLEF